MIALGFLLATFAAAVLAKKRGLNSDKLVDCALVSFIGGIIGARLYHVALNPQYFCNHPNEILATWLGGLSIHGGLLGGVIAGAIFCRVTKFPFIKGCDVVGAVLPLAQAVGRWGNFFNSEAFGRPMLGNYPIKLFIADPYRPPVYEKYFYFHPTFLYECIWDLAIFAVLYFYLSNKLKDYPGMTFLAYLVLYSFGRFLIEPLRLDSIMFGSVPVASVVSGFLFVVAALAMGVVFSVYKRRASQENTESQSSAQ
jgi:phosphatidylglycerol:prolipoprotein diacylglycerol transferase